MGTHGRACSWGSWVTWTKNENGTNAKDSPWSRRRWSPSVRWPTPQWPKRWSSPRQRKWAAPPWTPYSKTHTHTGTHSNTRVLGSGSTVWETSGQTVERVRLCLRRKRREIPQARGEKSCARTHHIVKSQCTRTMACDREGRNTSAEKKYRAGTFSLCNTDAGQWAAGMAREWIKKLNQAKSISVRVLLCLMRRDWASSLRHHHPLSWKSNFCEFSSPAG